MLRNYTTYKTMFEYIENNTAYPTMAMTTEGVAHESEELYGEKKSVALILRKLNSEPENMTLKARAWRNEEAHSAPEFSDEELKAAVHILVTMYAYVTAKSITNLEMNGM